MKQSKRKTYLFWILLTEGVGLLSGLISRQAINDFPSSALQPDLSPPAILFPIVWTVLYALMGIGAARIRLTQPSPERSHGLNLFIGQLIVNFFWSPIFFNAKAYGFAFLWLILLWVLVLFMILNFRKSDSVAAGLQIPYLVWLTAAAYLNWTIWLLNK